MHRIAPIFGVSYFP
uniref:Uncharacterized protein n=1 Tax=Arundo donax TaxID=35708 RepID=A0A0A8ZZ43_ARUDO